jgi:hypothetical protein
VLTAGETSFTGLGGGVLPSRDALHPRHEEEETVQGGYRSLCPSHVEEPAGAGVGGAFPEAVHARRSLEEPGIGGMLRVEVGRQSRRRRRSGVSRLRPPRGGPKMISAPEAPPENRPDESRGVRRRALLPGERSRHPP